ncbi:MAG: sugar transferase [Bacteroidia bacterium]|jgi:lipopolysaccharide/colanic/teichoic acid biosynthesis glycosyltransferase
MKSLIIQKASEEAYDYFSKFVDIESDKTFVVSTTNIFNILNNNNKFTALINLSRTNDIRFINKFFEAVNSRLNNNDVFVGCLETISSRMQRLPIGKIPVIGSIYYSIEFIFNRISPKIIGLKKIYFLLTRGRNRLLSKAEVLGRLVCCGFEIVDFEQINGLTYFVAKKVKEPAFDMNPSYGPLYKMPRIGKNGKIIKVYKMRTMHPYAEYLHSYILKHHGYGESGKPANDFRLTPWGKLMRKYWLDELPQLINVLKGDLKLVGVRPISQRYFQDIPKELQTMRLKHKPGCIPPYVALNRKSNVKSVLQAEREYMEEKARKPYTTDIKYFFKALFNIIFRKKRSA